MADAGKNTSLAIDCCPCALPWIQLVFDKLTQSLLSIVIDLPCGVTLIHERDILASATFSPTIQYIYEVSGSLSFTKCMP